MKQINLFLKTAIIILFLFFNKGYAQNPNWALQYEYLKPSGLNFLPGGAFPQMEYAANMITDQSGNPQFFIYDGEVIDKNGNTIANLSWSKRVHPNNYFVKSYSCYNGAYNTTRND
ncbi:MAG: hypothetical protein IPG89_00825 [Bacteroidetes bacterium]|nr:hypothetical protein [Bacteroidota bacterium]